MKRECFDCGHELRWRRRYTVDDPFVGRITVHGKYLHCPNCGSDEVPYETLKLVEEVRKRVDAAGIKRSKITIEITESVIMDDVDFMKTQVERFRELGFRVWMDDFGSGYSSPDILQRIHFDVIKIDKVFIDRIEDNEGSRFIVSELIRLARGLGSETVAEGVESKKQAILLKEMGCTRLQGYYYCKPVPLETIFERNRLGIQIGFESEEEAASF